MHKLFIGYVESETNMKDENGYGDRVISFQITGAYSEDPGGHDRQEFSVDWDPAEAGQAVVLVHRYAEGNTFGRSVGCWDIVKVYATVREARAEKESRESGNRWSDSSYDLFPSVVFR